MSTLRDDVLRVVGNVLGPAAEGLSSTSTLKSTLDSVEYVELVFTLEDEFAIRFADEEIGQLTSIEQIIKLVEQHITDTRNRTN